MQRSSARRLSTSTTSAFPTISEVSSKRISKTLTSRSPTHFFRRYSMSRRTLYRTLRGRSQSDGGAGLAIYRMQEREKQRKENNRISKRVGRDLGGIARGAANFLIGTPRRRRRRK